MPAPTVQVRFSRSSSWMRSSRLRSSRMPWRSGTAPSVRPVPPERGTTGMRKRLAIRTISATSSVLAREHDGVGDVVGPAVDGERRGHARAVEARRARGDQVVGAEDLGELLERAVVDPAGGRDAHALDPQRLGEQLVDVDDVDLALLAGLRQRPLRPRAGGDERVDLELGGVLQPARADLRRDLRLLHREAGAGARAVGPLGDAVDVAEVEARGSRAGSRAAPARSPCACSAGTGRGR